MKPDFKKMDLIPAVVQDYNTREVLMLAYVNEESYNEMLRTKQTCFYSRSRKKLWRKGETSGNIQKIKEMLLDCDNDTLLIFVEQIGGACHTGSYSCFFNKVITSKEAEEDKYEKNNKKIEGKSDKKETNNNILEDLYNLIKDRDINPKERSYTNYLLNEGIDKICKKIGEEATETVIAAKNDNSDDLIGEICDLIYHTEVLMYNKKITIEQIEDKLNKRHKTERNKKIQNIRGEY